MAGCWLLGSFELLGQTCTITPVHTDVLCYGGHTGSIDISVGGGTEPYIFSWTGPDSFASTSQNLTGLGAGSYTVTVIGAAGSCTGTETVIIGQPTQPLTITTQPSDQTDCYGNTVEFSVEVSGVVGTISYQWQSRPPGGNFADISGENSSILTIHDIGVNGQNIDGTEYQVIITDNCETITSEPALLSINSITSVSGSVNLTICSGGNAAYEVQTHGSVVGYQWSFNNGTDWDPVSDGGSFSGTTSSRLTISDATVAESGSYRVSVTFNTLNQPEDYPTCVITSHTRTRNLTVLPSVSPPVVSAAQTVCYNGIPVPLNATPASGGSGPDYSYQWQSSPDGDSWTDLSGAQAFSYSPPALTTSTWYHIVATDEGPLHCGTVYSLPVEITVDPLLVATITSSGPTTFCEGGSVVLTSSSASSYLWSTGETTQEITVISSGSYSVTVSDDCGNTSTCSQAIEVTDNVTPVFMQIGFLCQNSIAPPLPETSINGIIGNWNPSSINTSTGGTTTYTFTPDAGQCAATATIDIVVTTSITPTFTQIGPFCQNTVAPDLPTNSNNGITGTWNPETISTVTVGTSTYTFVPDAGQCAGNTTMDIVVTTRITPTFAQIGPICQNSVAALLPSVSNNGITGTWNPTAINTASVGITTYIFTPDAGQCASAATIDIMVTTSITPTFNQIGPFCQNSADPILPATSNNGITGTWNPETISTSAVGTTTYTFTPDAEQCSAVTTMSIEVTNSITPTFTQIGPLCQNSTAPALPATSNNGTTGTWNPETINSTTVGTTTYTFTPDTGQCAATATMDIIVTTSITPTFTQIGPLCQNSTAPALPTNSNNGISGTWNPETINTSAVGTSTYTFTPDPGQCAGTTTMDIVVTTSITPTFTQIGPLCQNSVAPVLPATSNNGITGTWNPETISTVTVGTSTYAFVPDAGQCAGNTTMDIVVTTSITPTFAQIGPICQNSVAALLPSVSNNGITGTWNPTAINTASVGITTYIFTPDAGQCASAATMDIIVTTSITPTFNQIGPFCQNSADPILPATSNNGITGTWNPETISTSAVGTSTYTFTPDPGQCAGTTTMDIVVTTSITPTFTQIGPLCQNSVAPVLPATSNNGITGTWNPEIISTVTVGTSTFTYTPAAGQCAATATMDIAVTTSITPTFTQIGPLCQNSVAPLLPATSINGITGTWNPETINTSAIGTTTYNFTPDVGQCAATATMDIIVTTSITPTFTQIGPLCQNSTAPVLPSTSNNGISGTWNPEIISTVTVGNSTYVFVPDAGQCAASTTIDIEITTSITPAFTQIGPLCQNSTAPALPAISNNGISGTWNPETINASAVGTSTYTFAPDPGQCAATAIMDIAVTTSITPAFTQIGPLCQNSTAPVLPSTSNNGISGTWNPEIISTVTVGNSTYVFVPDAGQCAASTTIDIEITTSITPAFTQIGPLCQNSTAPALPAISNNGITGTWNPETINTSSVGTSTYTFTPDPGQCAGTTTMDIVVTTSITPTFTQIGPLCQNSIAPVLPTTSNNGITGTWSPSLINTAFAGTTTYTFTADAGQCAATATMDIEVTTSIIPTFNQIGPFCQNTVAPDLPTNSNNGITGTWNPETVGTSAVGNSVYTFTPDAGQCASAATIDIMVTTSITPTFTPIGLLCQNSIAPVLPSISTNGITGTWNPAVINTVSVGTTTYTFTPDVELCAISVTMDIYVTTSIIPTFTLIGTLYQNSVPPLLPAISSNGISGIWNPATINTSVVGTTTHTFTPDAGQCAAPFSMNIEVTNSIVPTFTQIGPLCQNSIAPILTTTSTNGITGTWNPAVINTASAGSTAYTFAPDADQGAAAATMLIEVTNPVTPTFTSIGPLCQNSIAPDLPATSNNGISGTWNPETINTSAVGTSTYTFTPDPGQCAGTTMMDIVVTTSITPTFTQIGPLFQNSVAPALPGISNEGVTGEWDPAIINTGTVGTTTYTFNPDAGQCAVLTAINIEVTNLIIPLFMQLGPFCQNSTPPVLPSVSMNGINGTWNPAVINTASAGSTAYTFAPDAGQGAAAATMIIEVTIPLTPTFTSIGPLCQNSTAPVLPATSNNGITGTWNPETINISAVGTSTYTFIPDAGQCAGTTTMDIVVTTSITPTFTQIGPLCQNTSAPSLPGTSNNGISGTWNPETLNTFTVSTTTYTFTPDAGQCAMSATMNIEVTTSITPSFIHIGPLCQNNVAPLLPATSNNGITGTWNPETINTSVAGTSTYFFTPDSGNCVLQPIMAEVSIYPQVQYYSETSDYNGFNISCYGKSNGYITIDPSTELAPFTFRWSGPDGFTATTEDITELKAGQYTLIIMDRNMCTARDTLNLTEPDSLQISFDITEPYCPGSHDGEIKLNVTGGVPIPDYNYYWSDNSTGRNLSNISQGFYKVTVSDINGCSVHNSVILNNKNIVCLEIPDAFSPNGDGINDAWNINGIHLYPAAMIIIYNRWGQMLWKSERGYPVPWDGRSRGEALPVDSYHYVIDLHNGPKPIIGTVTIIR